MAFEETAPAGTDTTFHLHHESDELVYVLSGEFTFKIDDRVTTGGPGTCAFIPRDVAHAWKNTGAKPGRALFLYTPGGAGRMFEEAKRLQRPLSSMDESEIAEFFKRFGWETVGPSPFCNRVAALAGLPVARRLPSAPYFCLLPAEQRMLVAELFFGRAMKGRAPVSDAEWAEFAAQTVTPNFPGGFTVFDGEG